MEIHLCMTLCFSLAALEILSLTFAILGMTRPGKCLFEFIWGNPVAVLSLEV